MRCRFLPHRPGVLLKINRQPFATPECGGSSCIARFRRATSRGRGRIPVLLVLLLRPLQLLLIRASLSTQPDAPPDLPADTTELRDT